MARWPGPWRCKSRLASSLGGRAAAVVQQRLLHHNLVVLDRSCCQLRCQGRLALAGAGLRAGERLAPRLNVALQGGGVLGTRMQRQFAAAFRQGYQQVVLIGSDLPELTCSDLTAAFAALKQVPLVLGPAHDGGYWLVGLSQPAPGLFAGIDWGSDRVLAQTLSSARDLQLPHALIRQQSDLDRPADLERWR